MTIYCTCGLEFGDEESFEDHVSEEMERDGCVRHWDVATI